MRTGKKFLKLILFNLLFSILCSPTQRIIRNFVPLADSSANIIEKQIDDIAVSIEFLNREKLLKIAKSHSNPFIGDSNSPQLTVFMIQIENRRKEKISVDADKSVLLDGLGNQLNVLTYETFKDLYPTTIGQHYEYSFIFNRYYVDSYYTDDYYKRTEAKKTLFKGGLIYPGVKVEGIIAFSRISQKADIIEVIIPSVGVYKNDRLERSIDFAFKYRQEVERKK